jgi:hypothetical protein
MMSIEYEPIPIKWLVRRVSIAETEVQGWLGPELVEQMREQMQKGDELWEFRSQSKTWRGPGHASAGYCVVRNYKGIRNYKKVIASVETESHWICVL